MFSALGKLITTPFAALFRWLYVTTGSYGLAIILFGLVVKLVVLPFQIKSKRSMVRMGRLSNKQAELQKKYANNQQKYQEELAKLYQEEGVNPMGGCLWSFLPLFILIPLYSIIRKPITSMMMLGEEMLADLTKAAGALGYSAATSGNATAYAEVGLARFISDNWSSFQSYDGLVQLDYNFLGLDLSIMPQDLLSKFSFDWAVIGILAIPVISAALSWLMSKVTQASNGQQNAEAAQQMRTMNLMMPIMSLWIGFVMPAALGLYWITNSVFGMIQEFIMGRFFNKKIEAEEEAKAAEREASRKARQEAARIRDQELRENPKAAKKIENKPKDKQRVSTNEAGRVGDRPYARGRSYVENRYEQE